MTRTAKRHPRPGGAVATAYGLLWAATAAGAALGAIGLLDLTIGAPRDALPAQLQTVAELVVSNARVALWPLGLIALGWGVLPVARPLGDVLIAAQILGHGLLVGTALAEHPDLWRYLPHLPTEWLALAVPAGAWLAARRHGPAPLLRTGLNTVALVALAALLETYAVPI